MRNPVTWVWESIVDASRFLANDSGLSGLRSIWRIVGQGFYPDRPVMDKTLVDLNMARSLYRNEIDTCDLGAGFARPIIDLTAEFMDLPHVSSEDEKRDKLLNECIHDYWAATLQEVFRNACRDSKTIVRLIQPDIAHKLVTATEREHGRLEILDPERVKIMRDPADKDKIVKAYVTHYVEFEEDDDPNTNNPNAGGIPKIVEHTIIETITPESYRYFDKTTNEHLPWGTNNSWGFVPLEEVFNEYDSTLSGGQSDLESVYPFLLAFHEVMLQSLQAHRYHSTPKIRFKVKDVASFIESNWPGTIEPGTSQPKEDAKINFKGKEIFFQGLDEDANFIEAKSVLGDSKTLLEFLIDCISIASETPEWGLMRVEGGTSQGAMNAQTLPFEKKIKRKRVAFQPHIQRLLKMILVVNGKLPESVTFAWPTMRVEEFVAKGQAMQQIIMGMDVAAQHEWIADPTVVKILATVFPEMNAPDAEMQLAKSNKVILPPPAPASDTQGAQNGKGSSKDAKKALTTTKGSNS